MRNMYNVIGMIILVVSAALGIVFTVAMDAVSAGSGAQIVLMILILEVVGLNVIVVLLVNRHTVYHRVNYHFQKATVVWVCGSGREIELIILLITHIHHAVNYSRPNYIIHTGVQVDNGIVGT